MGWSADLSGFQEAGLVSDAVDDGVSGSWPGLG